MPEQTTAPVYPQQAASSIFSLEHKPVDNGLGLCTICERRVHRMVYYASGSGPFNEKTVIVRRATRHNPVTGLRPIHDNDRTQCSSCGRRFEAWELKPGDGRCRDCQP